MRMRTVLLASIVGALVAIGCKKDAKKSPEGASSASGLASALGAAAGGDLQAFLKDENAPLTPQIEEQLLLGLKDCQVKDSGIDGNCEGLKSWNKSRGRKTAAKQALGGSSNLGSKYIGHESPAIRYKAADLMSSLFGADASTQKAIVDAAKKEQVPGVLANMIQTVGSKHKSNEDVKQLLLSSADHPSERVRMEALGWFLTSFGEGVPGTFEKVLEKMAKDPSNKVRAHLCSRLYGSSDERAIPIFEKYLNDKATPEEVLRGCWDGTIAAWTGHARPEKPNQKAFELTVKMLEATPRTKERPPWSGMSTLRSAKTELKPDDTFGQAWLTKVKPWYKKERLLKALEAVSVDTSANWMARTNAIETMKELGAPKAALERVQKKYASADKGDDSLVKKKVDDLVKGM